MLEGLSRSEPDGQKCSIHLRAIRVSNNSGDVASRDVRQLKGSVKHYAVSGFGPLEVLFAFIYISRASPSITAAPAVRM